MRGYCNMIKKKFRKKQELPKIWKSTGENLVHFCILKHSIIPTLSSAYAKNCSNNKSIYNGKTKK